MTFQKNQILEAEIIDMNILGLGIAKIDGAIIFVQHGVTGDKGTIRIIKCAKNYYIARIEKLLVFSPHRTTPLCNTFQQCGGCLFQHITYSLERDIKKKHVEICLKKVGVNHVKVFDVLSTDQVEGYRNKAQFPVAKNEDGEVYAGFYSQRSHNICRISECNIQDPTFFPIVDFLSSYFTKENIKPYVEEQDRGLIRHIFLRRGKNTGEIMLCLVLRHDSFPKEELFVQAVTRAFPAIKSIILNINEKKTNVILGEKCRVIFGKTKIEDVLCGKRFALSPLSFYQVNHDGAELLFQTAFSISKVFEHDLLLDLYCGIGSISLSVSENIPAIGVEIVPAAVEDAIENAKLNRCNHARYVCGDAKDAFKLVSDCGAKNPLLILDPPRKGLDKSLIFQIAEKKIPKILYISCNPDTLTRDIALFEEYGYFTDFIQPVDMFPRTGHVECITVLKPAK